MKIGRLPVAAAIQRNIDANDLTPTRPGEASQLMDTFFQDRLFWTRRGDDRLGLHYPGEHAGLAVFHQVGVF